MAKDFSKMTYTDDPTWLRKITAVHGNDDGEITAISPKLLHKARAKNQKEGVARGKGKDLLKLLLSK